MCISPRPRYAPGQFQLWWYEGGVTLVDGEPEPVCGGVKLCEGDDPFELCERADAWADWARFEYGDGELVLCNSSGEILPLEFAAA